MKIELPATLTAYYEPDDCDRYQESDSGTIQIQFGGCNVLAIRVEHGGRKFDDNAEWYRGMAQEELSEFVAQWLNKVFTNALAGG